MLTGKQIMDSIHKVLEDDGWGAIEPGDLKDGGEYYNELKEVFEKIATELNSKINSNVQTHY